MLGEQFKIVTAAIVVWQQRAITSPEHNQHVLDASVSHVPWFRRTLVLFPTTCFARVLGKPSLTPPRLGLVVVECTPQKISGRLFFLAIRTRIVTIILSSSLS